MKDIFATFEYACEKISESGCLKTAGYSALKRMVAECRVAFENKYGSVENLIGIRYHLDEINELYALIDSGLENVDMGIRCLVEKHLFQNLISHVKELKRIYEKDE